MQPGGTSRLLPNLLLAVLLVAAQFGAALHAFEHDIGALQGKVCSTCVTAAQLGTAAIDDPEVHAARPAITIFPAVATLSGQSRRLLVARQRAPPATL